MIKISNPLIKQGELITHYNGYNRKINQSEQHLTSQRIKFITSQEINGGEEANYCFEFELLNRKFLMALDQEKLYEKPNQNIDAPLGKFEELKAVEDAVRYMKKGEQATLLVPSVLAFGTYGDDEKIPNDMPLIIKIKIL